jgi:hypothetical protein
MADGIGLAPIPEIPLESIGRFKRVSQPKPLKLQLIESSAGVANNFNYLALKSMSRYRAICCKMFSLGMNCN